MRLAVFSHKPCWPCTGSPTGYATDGGFSFQLKALSELFDETRLLVPCHPRVNRTGEIALEGDNLSVVPLSLRSGSGFSSKLSFMPWLLLNCGEILRELRRADAVHAPIPGDVGTVGMLGGWLCRKPLFVRHCGNWLTVSTGADRFWHWFMERFAGGRNVMLATGGAFGAPSRKNARIRWIFSSSLSERELGSCGRERAFPASGGMRLITVGRQDGGKGTDALIKALGSIQNRYPEAFLDVLGDGSTLPGLRRLAAQLGLSDKVRFHGKVNHEAVLGFLQQADLFCLPSASEGFPKAVVEALACGLPAVATRVSVLPQLLGSGCGVLIDEATPEAVACGIRQAMSYPARYEAMSRKAITTACQYSLEAWRDTIGGYLAAAWGPLREARKSVARGPAASSPVVRGP